MKISHIVQVENLSHHQAKKYLDNLLSAGLIQAIQMGQRRVYRPTNKGIDFATYFTKAMKLARNHKTSLNSGTLPEGQSKEQDC